MVLLGLDLPGLGVSWESPEACDDGFSLPTHHFILLCICLSCWQNPIEVRKFILSPNFPPNFDKEISETHDKYFVGLSNIVLQTESSVCAPLGNHRPRYFS